jgi:peptidoglycan/xylan/chitin deacetylase (PgdA/CDA1 family)
LLGVAGLIALSLAAGAAAALPPSLDGGEWDRIPTSRKVVALTFDCGGSAAGVAEILSTLARSHATATFFLTGRFAEAYPARARRIASRYPVGNHTYSHPDLTALAATAVVDEVRRGARAIRRAARRDPRPLFRFPYGARDARTIGIVNGLGYGAIGWTVDTLGWMGRAGGQTAGSVVQRVLAALRPGAIVLMHAGAATDGTTLDAEALPRLIAAVRARGYELVTVRRYLSPPPSRPPR